jgi:hypothetical protein
MKKKTDYEKAKYFMEHSYLASKASVGFSNSLFQLIARGFLIHSFSTKGGVISTQRYSKDYYFFGLVVE